jgi:hypothetical protein
MVVSRAPAGDAVAEVLCDAVAGQPSPGAAPDMSPEPGRDAVAVLQQRRCGWCRGDLRATQRLWCSKSCRQTAWRARGLAVVEDFCDTPKRLGYADPPYPGTARRYYQHEPNYAGEVDHAALLSRLEPFDGWALSTSAKALPMVLPLCPPGIRICVWCKPHGVSSKTRGPHNVWEAVIVKPARLRRPGVPDALIALPARGGGTLPGRKPIAFCMWLFQLLGASPVDALDDLFPGSGVVSRCFEQFKRVSLGAGRGA